MKIIIILSIISIYNPLLAQRPDREDIESIRRIGRATSAIQTETSTAVKVKIKTLSDGKVEMVIEQTESQEVTEKESESTPKRKLKRRCDELDL